MPFTYRIINLKESILKVLKYNLNKKSKRVVFDILDELEGNRPFSRRVEMSIDDALKIANMLILKQLTVELSGNAINASVDNFCGQSTVLTIVYNNGNGTRSLICNFSDFHKFAIEAVNESCTNQ